MENLPGFIVICFVIRIEIKSILRLLDYYAGKHILMPLGGNNAQEHDPDSYAGLINHLSGARDVINANGGIAGEPVRLGDENIEVISSPPYVPYICEGDFDMDGEVTDFDQARLAQEFGRSDCRHDCNADFAGDHDVDGPDLAAFVADFGNTDCP